MLLWDWWTWLWPVLRATPPLLSPKPKWGRSTWAARTSPQLCGTKNGPRLTTAGIEQTHRFQDFQKDQSQLYCSQYVIQTLQWSTSMEKQVPTSSPRSMTLYNTQTSNPWPALFSLSLSLSHTHTHTHTQTHTHTHTESVAYVVYGDSP